MPGPAARLGDTTAHGGAIVAGFPTVLIGGQPAARLTDMHTCPMQTPAPVPIPHVGGPVAGPGVPTVLIGNMPAATIGDMLVCVGPPDAVVKGCPTVIIGMAGSGVASGGGAGGAGAGGGSGSGSGGGTLDGTAENIGFGPASAPPARTVPVSSAAAATASAVFTTNGGNRERTTQESHWVEFRFLDSAGLPVSDVPYELTLPDGHKLHSRLDNTGVIRRGGLEAAGQASVALMSVRDAKWSVEKAKVGEAVRLSAKVEGFEPGTPARVFIYQKDIKGAVKLIGEKDAEVRSEAVEVNWTYAYPDDPEAEEAPTARAYSNPEFYFEVRVGSCNARSGLLVLVDDIELDLVDGDGQPIRNEPFIIYFAHGAVRNGRLDGNGHTIIEDAPLGSWSITFPNLPDLVVEG